MLLCEAGGMTTRHLISNDPQRFHPDRYQCSACPMRVRIDVYGPSLARKIAHAHIANPVATIDTLLLFVSGVPA